MSDALTPSEQAFFDTRGETAPVVEETNQPAVVDAPANDQPPADEGQARDANGKFIPHAVFHAEREEHKKTRSELEEVRKQQAVLNDRWNTLLSANKEPEQQKPEIPDPENDIFGYMKYQGEQLKALQDQTAAEKRQAEEQRQAQAAQQDIDNTWRQSATAFAAKEPTFMEAATFLSNSRHQQLEAMSAIYPQLADPKVRDQQISEETFQIVQAAKAANKDPAEVIFEMSKKYGYTPTSSPDAVDPNAAVNQKLDNLTKAINANKTLTGTNGPSSADPDTAEAVAKMTDSEFSAWYAKNPGKFQKMMGA